MSKVSRKEFGIMCNKKPNYIGIMVNRGKIVEDQNKKINTELPINYAYFVKCNKPGAVVEYEKKQKVQEKVKTKVKEKVAKIIKKEERAEKIIDLKDELIQQQPKIVQQEYPVISGLEKAIKEAQLEKINIDIKEKEIKVAKLNGEVIPFDLVQLLFNQHSKSITTAFHNAVDNIITDLQKELEIKRDQVSKIRGELISSINQSIDESISISKKSLKNIVEEYSIKKGIGERN